jgi:hypothetical protein
VSRNADAHDAFYAARDHGVTEGPHPLMDSITRPTQAEHVITEMRRQRPEHAKRFEAEMGRQGARAGGWAGHQPGPMDPQSQMSGEIARTRRSGYEGPNPVLKKAPSKPFRPR